MIPIGRPVNVALSAFTTTNGDNENSVALVAPVAKPPAFLTVIETSALLFGFKIAGVKVEDIKFNRMERMVNGIVIVRVP